VPTQIKTFLFGDSAREDQVVELKLAWSLVMGPPESCCFDLSLRVRSGLMVSQEWPPSFERKSTCAGVVQNVGSCGEKMMASSSVAVLLHGCVVAVGIERPLLDVLDLIGTAVEPRDVAEVGAGVNDVRIARVNGNAMTAAATIPSDAQNCPREQPAHAQSTYVDCGHDFHTRLCTQQDNSSVAQSPTASDRGYIDAATGCRGGSESGYVAVDPRDCTSFTPAPTSATSRGLDRPYQSSPKHPAVAARSRRLQRIRAEVPLHLDDAHHLFSARSQHSCTTPHSALPFERRRPFLGNHQPRTSRATTNRSSRTPAAHHQRPSQIEFYDLIFAVAESPKQKGLIWVGTDDGLIQLTRDDGKNWSNVTPKGFPEWPDQLDRTIAFEAGTAYAAIDAHKLDDFKPYIFKTLIGKDWSQSPRPPRRSYVHAVREDPKRKGLLYAGTETGAWVYL